MIMIAVSPLTGRVYSGRVNKTKDAFIGKKIDVTSEVLRVILEKAEFHGGEFDIQSSDGTHWIVIVKKE